MRCCVSCRPPLPKNNTLFCWCITLCSLPFDETRLLPSNYACFFHSGKSASLLKPVPALGQLTHTFLLAGNSSIGPGPESHASFSFVGLKGPNATASAPFRLAPPTNVVLNNLFCWPLLRPSASTAAAAAGAASSGDSSPALGRAAATASGVAERVSAAVQVAPAAASGQRQVSVPQVPEEELPRQLLVEYVPVDYLPEGLNRPAYFYFK